jgi:hypothetical protein
MLLCTRLSRMSELQVYPGEYGLGLGLLEDLCSLSHDEINPPSIQPGSS